MKNSKTWTCDGIPKDGEDYGVEPHPDQPCENSGPNCLQCGLPREAIESKKSGKKSSGLPTKTLITAGTALAVVLVGGTGGFYLWRNFQGCPSGEEKINGACVTIDSPPEADPNQENYEQAVQLIDQALPQTENYNDLNTLRVAHQNLQAGLEKLEKIPEQASVYSKAQTKFNQHQPDLSEVKAQIQKEREAQDILVSADAIAAEAREKTPTAESQDLSQLKTAQQEWENALSTLENAPEGTLVSSDIEDQRNSYQEQLNQLQSRIDTVAEEQRQQREAADRRQREAEARRQREAEARRQREAEARRRREVEARRRQQQPQPQPQPSPNCQQEPKPEQCLW